MNGVFAIEKPSGITSSQFLLKLQNILNASVIFGKDIEKNMAIRAQEYQKQTGKTPSKRVLRKVAKVKMGHGGTLDPLASGVLVVGIGSGTKRLQNYLTGCTKTYEAEALFGLSTTSGDCEGEVLSQSGAKHITLDMVKSCQEKFVGALKQTPPIYAALKMNGKPLHEYARQGIPLPRAIEPRQVTVHSLEVFDDTLSTSHGYKLLQKDDQLVKDLNANIDNDTLYYSTEYCEKHGKDSEIADVEPPMPREEDETDPAPLLHFKATVSSGTYIRSLVSDIGKAVRSSAYMVKLVRSQQKEWSLDDGNVFKIEDFEKPEAVWSPVLSLVLENPETKVAESLKKASEEYEKQQKDIEEKMEKDVEEQEKDAEQLKVEGEAVAEKRPLEE